MSVTRACTHCGVVKPLDVAHFRPLREGTAWTPACRTCLNAEEIIRRRKRKEKVLAAPPALAATKPCKVCGVAKPLDEFHHDYKMRDTYQNTCKACRYDDKQRKKRVRREAGLPALDTISARNRRVAAPAKRVRATGTDLAPATPIPRPVGRHAANWFTAITAVQEYWRLLRDAGGMVTVAQDWKPEQRGRYVAAIDAAIAHMVEQRQALDTLNREPRPMPNNVRQMRPG